MKNVTERRTSLETAHQKSKNMLVQEQTEQMQRLELMERVAIAIGDVLSARHTELSPIDMTIFSRLGGVSDIHLSADSWGRISTWALSMDNDIPF